MIKFKLSTNFFNRFFIFFIFFLIISYIFLGTGLHGDDVVIINNLASLDFYGFIKPDPKIIGTKFYSLIEFYLFYWPYIVLGFENQIIYDFIKIVIHLLSIWLIFKFASDYLPSDRAFFMAILFIFYPTHETTLYYYGTIFYTITPALILYSHHLIRHNKYFYSFPILIIGSFFSYCSPPYIFGLGAIFFFERLYKKGLLFFGVGISYIIYYFTITNIFPFLEVKIENNISLIIFIKNFIIQLLGFIDVFIGPSFWIKIYLSINSIGLTSLLVSFIVIIFFSYFFKSKNTLIPWSLFFGLLVIVLLSLFMYASTGAYNQIIFNLGNRVTIYGSLFLVLLIMLLPNPKILLFLIYFIIIIPTFGLSDYWKSWNKHQKVIINNIQNNEKIKLLKEEDLLLIKGNIYSKIGPFSHIELFSMPWVTQHIFSNTNKSMNIMALNSYTYIKDDEIINPKYGIILKLSDKINVYDSEQNILEVISKGQVEVYLKHNEKNIRHWIQLLDKQPLKKMILYLSPRLNIYFTDE